MTERNDLALRVAFDCPPRFGGNIGSRWLPAGAWVVDAFTRLQNRDRRLRFSSLPEPDLDCAARGNGPTAG